MVPGNCPARGMVPPIGGTVYRRLKWCRQSAARSMVPPCWAARFRRRPAEPPADWPAAGGGGSRVAGRWGVPVSGRQGVPVCCRPAGRQAPPGRHGAAWVWCRLGMVPPIGGTVHGGAVHGGTVLPGGCGLACMVPAIAGVVPGGAVSGRRGSLATRFLGDCAGPGEGHVKKQSVGLDGSGGRPGALLGAASGKRCLGNGAGGNGVWGARRRGAGNGAGGNGVWGARRRGAGYGKGKPEQRQGIPVRMPGNSRGTEQRGNRGRGLQKGMRGKCCKKAS